MNETPTLEDIDPSFDDLEALPPPPVVRRQRVNTYRGDDDALENLQPVREEADLCKGWMKFHRL